MPDAGGSGWYVYGVVRAPAPPLPDLGGMDGNGLLTVAHEDLAAVVTEVVLPRPPGRRRDLLSHSDVLNAVSLEQDVVPLTFGTVVPDEEALVWDVLDARHDDFADSLAQVAGAVQLNLRVSYVEERVLTELVERDPTIAELRRRTRGLPDGVPHPEAIRLGQLVADRLATLRADDSAVVLDAVLPLVRDTRERERGNIDHVADLALLVDRDSVDLMETELESLARDVHDRMRLELVGPLAPFDFARPESRPSRRDTAWA